MSEPVDVLKVIREKLERDLQFMLSESSVGLLTPHVQVYLLLMILDELKSVNQSLESIHAETMNLNPHYA